MAWRPSPLLDQNGSAGALPEDWSLAWGAPSPFYRRQLAELRDGLADLATGISLLDDEGAFGPLVAPVDNETAPIHRWYSYKEAFSYRLPKEVLARFGAGRSGVVSDAFGGVATTALSLQGDPRVDRVLSVEYSPFAHLVGRAKLSWFALHPSKLRQLLRRVLRYPEASSYDVPELAAFHNREIFRPKVLRGLIGARLRIDELDLEASERAFFLTGLAAVIEDTSGAMKDGRALRIRRDRQTKHKHLIPQSPAATGERDLVRRTLEEQWTAMIEDIEMLAAQRRRIQPGQSRHLRGDARELDVVRWRGCDMFPDDSVGLFVYSPPYLNCIDYSEVYKLELWLLELITSQSEFRDLRLGTVRSHPSVEFPARNYLVQVKGSAVYESVEAIAGFVERNHVRPQIGRMIWNYFDDMYQVFVEQYRTLEPGGHAVCVVGNSTFSRRDKTSDGTDERWRIPLLTDVILARLAEAAGFVGPQIWHARGLRPRNVNEGSARESLVVVRKPDV